MKHYRIALAVGLLLSACRVEVGQRAEIIGAVSILTPAPNTVFGTADDLSPPIDDGVSTEVIVSVSVQRENGNIPAPDGTLVRLRRNDAGEATATTSNGQARFAAFSLESRPTDEQVPNILVACAENAAGDSLCSAPVTVQTDVKPPSCSVVVPNEGDLLTLADDADSNALNGFQLDQLVVSTDSGDGSSVFLQINGSDAGSEIVSGSLATFANLTLQSGVNQTNTFQVRCIDSAGNETTSERSVTVNLTIPAIAISDPAPNSTISSQVDPATLSVTVQTQFVEPGQGASLLIDNNVTLGPVAVEANGTAVFGNVQLAEGSHTLQASVEDLAGTPAVSLPVTVLVDVIDQPPVVQFLNPLCANGQARFFLGNDTDSTLAGFQTTVQAISSGTSVDLSANLPSGATFTDTQQVSGTSVFFPSVTLEVGSNPLTLTPVDATTGLTGNSIGCNFIVQENDFLSFVAPITDDVFGAADDADGNINNGFQLAATIQATAGVSDGTQITVSVNGVASPQKRALVNGVATFDGAALLQIPNDGQIALQAQVTGAATIDPDTVTVTVDTNPALPVSNLACTLQNARQGTVQCSFTAPTDIAPGTGIARYEVRLLEDKAFTEDTFADGVLVASPTASAPGTTETLNLAGARPGSVYHVALVSIDNAGNRSLISNDAVVSVNGQASAVDFANAVISAPAANPTDGQFGLFMEPLGDINGDGFDDVAVAAPLVNTFGGEVYIYYGSAQAPAQVFASPDVIIRGADFEFVGFGLVGLGDFNNDGLDDVAVSSSDLVNASVGAVNIFLGRSGAQQLQGVLSPSQADLRIANDPNADIILTYGIALASLGDVDNDGFADLLISDAALRNNNGSVYLIYGRSINTAAVETLPEAAGAEYRGEGADDNFGVSLTGLGDIDGDGFDDFAIGANEIDQAFNDAGPGYVMVFRGGPRPSVAPVGAGALSRAAAHAFIAGEAATENFDFGASIAGIGSPDNDGTPSLAISDPSVPNGAIDFSGNIYLFDDVVAGDFVAANASQVIALTSVPSRDNLGNSLARNVSVGGIENRDIDGDGFGDVLFSSLKLGGQPGGMYLFYGSTNYFAKTALDAIDDSGAIIRTDAGIHDFSNIAQFLGDVNGDGFEDFAFSDVGVNNNAGVVIVFF